MTAPASNLLQLLFSLGLVLPSSYAAGRIHQWYAHSLRRDSAFRQGYDQASHAMFDLALKNRVTTTGGVTGQATPGSAAASIAARAVVPARDGRKYLRPTAASAEVQRQQAVAETRSLALSRISRRTQRRRRDRFPE
jgi:hypothetical protein